MLITGFLFTLGVLLCLLCLRFWRFLLLAAALIAVAVLLLLAGLYAMGVL